MGKHRKKKLYFGKIYIAYVAVLLAIIVFLFFYVLGVAKEYEATQPENYVIQLIEHVNKNDKAVGAFLTENCFSDSNYGDGAKRSADFFDKAGFGKHEAVYDYANSTDDLFVYNITSDKKPYVTVAIQRVETKTKLILFNINYYELKYVVYRNEDSARSVLKYNEDGSLPCEVIYPAEFTLLLDGKEVHDQNPKACALEEFESMKPYSYIPQGNRSVFDLYYEPKVEVLNNAGEKVPVEFANGVYYAACNYAEDDRAKDIIDDNLDPLEIYKLWAEFSNDEVGGSVHGIYKVLDGCKILPDSNLEEAAIDYAYGIDISFVSDHYDHWFSNDKIGNYIYYNEGFVSCDLSFDGTYKLNNGSTKVVNWSARMYFIKDDGEWYWVGQKDIDK